LLESASESFPKNIEPLEYRAAIYLLLAGKENNKKLRRKGEKLVRLSFAYERL
jgi:hypothetical protein